MTSNAENKKRSLNIWQHKMLLSLILSHYLKAILVFSADRKDRESYTAKLALWVSTQQPGRAFDRDSSTPPATVQDQSFRKIAPLWHKFLHFLLNCDGGHMKAHSCVILKRPRACWISLTDGSVSMHRLFFHRWRKQEGKRQNWSFCSQFSELDAIPSTQLNVSSTCHQCHLDTQHPMFVYSVCVYAHVVFLILRLASIQLCLFVRQRNLKHKIPQKK